MREVLMKIAELSSTREDTDRLLKIIDITYVKEDLKQLVNNATKFNNEERTQLLRLLKYFKDLFDGTLGDWDTYPVNLDLKTGSRPFNSKYYSVPIINKEKFCKEIKCLVEIGLLNPVQHS